MLFVAFAKPEMPDDVATLGVTRLGYGAMRLPSSPSTDRNAAIQLLRRAVEIGVELVDTAYMYGAGSNEQLIAEALHPYRRSLCVATKVGIRLDHEQPNTGPPLDWAPCGRPEFLRSQTEQSLQRLRIEQIDLLQLHRVDPAVPLAEQLGTLADLQREGRAARIGLSEVDENMLEQALKIATISSVQNKYSVGDRTHDLVLEMCERHGIAFLAWRPLDAGTTSVAIDEVAADLDATPPQVALAWLLQRSPVLHPIPGTTSIDHLEQNTAACQVTLDDHHRRRLDSTLQH